MKQEVFQSVSLHNGSLMALSVYGFLGRLMIDTSNYSWIIEFSLVIVFFKCSDLLNCIRFPCSLKSNQFVIFNPFLIAHLTRGLRNTLKDDKYMPFFPLLLYPAWPSSFFLPRRHVAQY